MKFFLTKKLIEIFSDEALLSNEEIFILTSSARGWTREAQATELHLSVSSIDKMIKNLKSKYDFVASYDDRLPARAELVKPATIK